MHSYYKLDDLRKILDSCVSKHGSDLGQADKVIESFESYDGYKEVVNQCRIYQKARRFVIVTSTKLYVIPFSKIIGYDILDPNKGRTPLFSATTTTTTTDTGNLVKRAIIGGALAGGVGAVVGGLTATKTTKSQSTAEEYASMMDRYINSIPNLELSISLDDLLSPSIKIPFGKFKKELEEFAATLNVVIKRNAETTENDDSEIINSSPAIRSTGKELGIEHRDPYLEQRKRKQEEEELKEAKEKSDSRLFTIVLVMIIIFVIFAFVLFSR